MEMVTNRFVKELLNSFSGKVRRRGIRWISDQPAFERLENRDLLSTIDWANEADFDDEFGDKNAAARRVINQAITEWELVIDSFNYRNVGRSGWSPQDSYTLNIDVRDLANDPNPRFRGALAYCGPDGIDKDGKPFSGSMTIDDDAVSEEFPEGWYFDETPGDANEFSIPISPYASEAHPVLSDPYPEGFDLYSVVLHELGHGLGFVKDRRMAWNSHISTNNVFTFNDGTFAYLTSDGFHTDESAHTNDLMNPESDPLTRTYISDLDARILGDGFGYSIDLEYVYSRSFVTTYAGNSADRRLTIHGDLGTSVAFGSENKRDLIYLNVMPGSIFVDVNGIRKTMPTRLVDSILVLGKDGSDVIWVEATRAGQPLTIRAGGGANEVILSPGLHNLNNIRGDIYVENKSDATFLEFQDENNIAARTFTIGHQFITFSGSPAKIKYQGSNPSLNVTGLEIRGGSGGNTYRMDNYQAKRTHTTIYAGASSDTVNVFGTSPGGLVIDGAGGIDQVNIGSISQDMRDILGRVFVGNSIGSTNLKLDDSGDLNASRNIRLNNTEVTGLGPASIQFEPLGIQSLTVLASNATNGDGNTITVPGTPQNRANNLVVNVSTGRNSDRVYVETNKAKLNIQGQNGEDRVYVGTTGRLSGITGTVSITNTLNRTALYVDNSLDTSARTLIVSASGMRLVSGFIFYKEADLKSLSVFCGAGPTTATVSSTPQNGLGTLLTNLTFGSAVDNVTIRGTNGPLQINGRGGLDNVTIGYLGKLNNIRGVVDVRNSGVSGYTNLKIDGSTESAAQTWVVDALKVTEPSHAEIRYQQSALNTLAIFGGIAGNTFNVLTTPQNSLNTLFVTVNSGTGVDTVNVLRTRSGTTINGQDSADVVNIGEAGKMRNIAKDVYITNLSSYSTINLDDSTDTLGRAVTLDAASSFVGVLGSVTGMSPGQILFKQADLRALNLRGSSNLDFFLVKNTANSNIPGGSPTTISAGQGADTIRVTGTTGALIVTPEGSNNLVNLGGDGAGSGSLTPLKGAVSVVGEGGDGNYLEIIDRASTGRYIYTMDGARLIRSGLTGNGPNVNLDFGEYTIVGMNFVGANKGNQFEISGTPNSVPAYPGGGLQMYTGDLNDVVNVTGTGSGQLNINLGSGSNQSISFGNATSSLDSIHSAILVSGGGFINATVSDAAASVPCFARFDRVAGLQVLDLYRQGSVYTLVNTFQFQFGGTGRLNYQAGQVPVFGQYNQIDVIGVAAKTEIVANGGPDKELFTVMLGTNVGTQAGPVTFNGSLQGSDQARYLEEFKGSSSQYSLQSNPLDASGLVVMTAGSPTVVFNGLTQLQHYMPRGGDNLTNIQSVPQNLFLVVVAGDGDAMTLGSAAPGQSGNMQNILGPIQVSGYTTDGEVTLTLDDSGNTTTARNASIVDYQGQYPWAVITGMTGNAAMLVRDHANWNLNILGGTLDDSFVMSGSALALNVSMNGGAGNDILIGSGGNSLFGGAGRDLLVAGARSSVLDGGLDEDILIGGTINDSSLSNLNEIRTVWTGNGDYNSRVSVLRDTRLSDDKVTGNGERDTLTGGLDALDLLFAELESDLLDGDLVTDREEAEYLVPLF